MPQNGTTQYWPDDAFKFVFLDGNELTAVVSGDLMKRVATMFSFSMEIETRARRARKRCRVEFTKSYSTQHIVNEVHHSHLTEKLTKPKDTSMPYSYIIDR